MTVDLSDFYCGVCGQMKLGPYHTCPPAWTVMHAEACDPNFGYERGPGKLTIFPGTAIIRPPNHAEIRYRLEEPFEFEMPNTLPGHVRVDRVFIRADLEKNTATLSIVRGVESSSTHRPQEPGITTLEGAGYYDFPLYQFVAHCIGETLSYPTFWMREDERDQESFPLPDPDSDAWDLSGHRVYARDDQAAAEAYLAWSNSESGNYGDEGDEVEVFVRSETGREVSKHTVTMYRQPTYSATKIR